MVTCARCKRKIKHIYIYKGKEYGIECWKRVIEEEKELQKEEGFLKWKLRCMALVKVLKDKSMSRIRNKFKLEVIPQLIKQWEQEGWLSKKQVSMVTGWFNRTDFLNYNKYLTEVGLRTIWAYLDYALTDAPLAKRTEAEELLHELTVGYFKDSSALEFEQRYRHTISEYKRFVDNDGYEAYVALRIDEDGYKNFVITKYKTDKDLKVTYK